MPMPSYAHPYAFKCLCPEMPTAPPMPANAHPYALKYRLAGVGVGSDPSLVFKKKDKKKKTENQAG